jgi:enoyl-CoA hydratase/carnithine racemase
MMLSGERIPAAQAESWGLVEFVVDDLDQGIERVAAALTAGSPFAQRELKRLLRVTTGGRSDSLELEAFARCVLSDDGREGIAAFLEKRAAAWSSSS